MVRPIQSVMGAHPRSRGENSGLAASSATWNGSSPLTRGKLTVEVLVTKPVRLIPAHAGKTNIRHLVTRV